MFQLKKSVLLRLFLALIIVRFINKPNRAAVVDFRKHEVTIQILKEKEYFVSINCIISEELIFETFVFVQ